jgi:hypothetical protein
VNREYQDHESGAAHTSLYHDSKTATAGVIGDPLPARHGPHEQARVQSFPVHDINYAFAGYFRRKVLTNNLVAKQGGSVAEYLPPGGGSVTYNFNAPVSGANVAVGDHARQRATINGIDADHLQVLMSAITQALPGLNLDAQDCSDVQDAAAQVISEIRQGESDHPRLYAALGKVRDVIARAGNQALAAVLGAAIDYERGKLGLPPAG